MMRPSEIYFSQDSIKNKFDNGQTIYSTLRMCEEDRSLRDTSDSNNEGLYEEREMVYVGQSQTVGFQKTGRRRSHYRCGCQCGKQR